MTLNIHWRLDPAAEPRRSEPGTEHALPAFIRDRRAASRNRFDYYVQVARAVAQTAFDGLFVRHRSEADESRIIAAIIARETPRLLVVPEFPASVGSAVYAAKQAATFQRATHGRLDWAIAAEENAASREAEADFVPDEDLRQRLDEFLTVARGVHRDRPFTFQGRHFEVLDGGFEAPLNQHRFPKLFLQGEDDGALALSARHADVHLFAPGPVNVLGERIATLNTLTAAEGRQVAAGLIQPLLVREDRDGAENDVQHLPLASGTLVASYDEAADQLAAYAAAGVTELLLEAVPTLEEAYRVGQHLLPRLRARTGAARKAA